MKMNVLSMVQNILSEMNSDNVNSISDTVESQMVANILKDTYYEMISSGIYPELKEWVVLNSSMDNNLPTIMYSPDNVSRIHSVKYNNKPVKYATLEYFDYLQSNKPIDSKTVTFQSYTYKITEDKDPFYFTILDNNTILFDSYNKNESSTLTSSRTTALVTIIPEFTLIDDFIPKIDSQIFPYFLAESKSKCFIAVKQTANAKVENIAQRLKFYLTRKKNLINEMRYPNYGRK